MTWLEAHFIFQYWNTQKIYKSSQAQLHRNAKIERKRAGYADIGAGLHFPASPTSHISQSASPVSRFTVITISI